MTQCANGNFVEYRKERVSGAAAFLYNRGFPRRRTEVCHAIRIRICRLIRIFRLRVRRILHFNRHASQSVSSHYVSRGVCPSPLNRRFFFRFPRAIRIRRIANGATGFSPNLSGSFRHFFRPIKVYSGRYGFNSDLRRAFECIASRCPKATYGCDRFSKCVGRAIRVVSVFVYPGIEKRVGVGVYRFLRIVYMALRRLAFSFS